MTKIPTDDENFFKCVQQVEELFDGMPPLQSSSRLCKGKKSGESNREKKDSPLAIKELEKTKADTSQLAKNIQQLQHLFDTAAMAKTSEKKNSQFPTLQAMFEKNHPGQSGPRYPQSKKQQDQNCTSKVAKAPDEAARVTRSLQLLDQHFAEKEIETGTADDTKKKQEQVQEYIKESISNQDETTVVEDNRKYFNEFINKCAVKRAHIAKQEMKETEEEARAIMELYNFGMGYLHNGQYKRAHRCFEGVADIRYTDGFVWMRMAECVLGVLNETVPKPKLVYNYMRRGYKHFPSNRNNKDDAVSNDKTIYNLNYADLLMATSVENFRDTGHVLLFRYALALRAYISHLQQKEMKSRKHCLECLTEPPECSSEKIPFSLLNYVHTLMMNDILQADLFEQALELVDRVPEDTLSEEREINHKHKIVKMFRDHNYKSARAEYEEWIGNRKTIFSRQKMILGAYIYLVQNDIPAFEKLLFEKKALTLNESSPTPAPNGALHVVAWKRMNVFRKPAASCDYWNYHGVFEEGVAVRHKKLVTHPYERAKYCVIYPAPSKVEIPLREQLRAKAVAIAPLDTPTWIFRDLWPSLYDAYHGPKPPYSFFERMDKFLSSKDPKVIGSPEFLTLLAEAKAIDEKENLSGKVDTRMA